jgi:hypothetical protein
MRTLPAAIFFVFLSACAQQKLPEPKERAPAKASMSALPAEIQTALVSLCGLCTFADEGAPWNPTDVIADDLPQRHLTKTTRRGSEWLIQYEHGGIATHPHTVVFSSAPSPHLVDGSSCMPSRGEDCEW